MEKSGGNSRLIFVFKIHEVPLTARGPVVRLGFLQERTSGSRNGVPQSYTRFLTTPYQLLYVKVD